MNVTVNTNIIEKLTNQTVCFTGHRPQALWGFDLKHPNYLKLKDKLIEIIKSLIAEQGITRFISGGALGVDQIAFWCVHIVKKEHPHIENILAVPFFNQDKVWTKEQKYWYNKIKKLADSIVYVDTVDKYTGNSRIKCIPVGEYSAEKMMLRNRYMVDNSKILIAVFKGINKSNKNSGTKHTYNYALEKDKIIYLLNPNTLELEIIGDDKN